MIPPKKQWCIQVDVTNACGRKCSNCTRLIGHVKTPFYMSVAQFSQAVTALCEFPDNSPPSSSLAPNKVVGMIGGEPLLHPQFSELVRIAQRTIPKRENRGLWTGLRWQKTEHASLIQEVFGYVNNNLHDGECRHSPVLIASEDVVTDLTKLQKIIDDCWLQRMWSGTITPKGFFFCEVAGAMDVVFGGPGGLPVTPDCWQHPLEDFKDQIDLWCHRCGIPLNLKGRIDTENVDDISPSNLKMLKGSPRIRASKYVSYVPETHTVDNKPWEYLK